MAHSFEQQLNHIVATVESLELYPFDVDLSPAYAEHDRNIRASRRKSLEKAREQIDAQVKAIRRIESRVQFLQRDLERRSALLHNACAPVHGLPPDVLGDIFTVTVHSINPLDDYYQRSPVRSYATSISHVCSYWRAVALQRPLLWSPIVVRRDKVLSDDVREWVRRSGDAPLDVVLYPSDLLPLMNLDLPIARIRSLVFFEDISPRLLRQYLDDLSGFVRSMSSLEHLRIYSYRSAERPMSPDLLSPDTMNRNPFDLNSFELPHLRRLEVFEFRRDLLELNPTRGSQLRHLSLCNTYLNLKAWRHIVHVCHSLETLRLSNALDEFRDSPEVGEIWEMNKLIRLEIYAQSAGSIVFPHMRFPDLRIFFIEARGKGRITYIVKNLLGVVRYTVTCISYDC